MELGVEHGEAEELLRQGMAQGCPCCHVWLARLSSQSDVSNILEQDAFALGLPQLARDGDPMAQLCFALLLYYG